MTQHRLLRTSWAAIALMTVTTAAAWAGAPAPRPAKGPKAEKKIPTQVTLEYKRDPSSAGQRGDAPPRPAPDLPDDLKIAPHGAASKTRPTHVVVPDTRVDAEGLGAQSGEKMAMEAARDWGWRQYWRAGFQRGMREALEEPHRSTWDRDEGFGHGRLDPRALALGGQIAQDAAADAAAEVAADRVRAQFTDLTREPRRSAAPSGGPVDMSRWLPATSWAVAPVFDDVFMAIPLASAPGLDRDARAALADWNVQPAVLARDTGVSCAYDARWNDAAHAFSIWRDRQQRGSSWSQWNPEERERLRTAFFHRFDEVMASLDLRSTYAGYRVGYADGWRYGEAVNAEWEYRQGYTAGFDEGVRAAATLSFPFLFDRAYSAAYDAEFTAWSTNPVPALDALRIVEIDNDGVIEPGERVNLVGEVINYGGSTGSFELRANGVVLDGPAISGIMLAARRRTPIDPLDLRIGGGVAPRTNAGIDVTVGDERVSVPIYVSRPLEIDGETIVDADALGGRLRLVFTVANRSRNPLHAEALISDLGGGAGEARREFLAIEGGGRARMEAAYEGLRPLDVIAGAPRWQAAVRNEGVLNDSRTITIVPASTDLANPDLVTFMVDLARTPQPASRDVSEARALLLDRIRVDWKRSCEGDGNPYKVDYKERSASTALGELVRAVSGARGSFVSRDVFAGVGPDIAALAEDLPGAHPLLRKWMKRLAKRV